MSTDKSKIHALLGVGAPPPAAAQQNTAASGTASPATPVRPPLTFGNALDPKTDKPTAEVLAIPAHLETKHLLMIGTSGSGKSQALYSGVLTPIRKRDEPTIIIDHASEFLQRYYREGTDVIFNPFDERSVGWSPFNEIRRTYDFDRIAAAIVPDVAGENQDWQIGARQLLANTMRGLWKLGKEYRANEPLLWFLTEAPTHGLELSKGFELPTSLEGLLVGSMSQRLFEKGNEKQLVITLGIVGRHLQPFTYLKDGDFSITDYVRQFEEVGTCRSWLFLSYTDAGYAAIAPLFSIMVTCAISSGMELSENNDRRFYFVLDEFSSLGKIDAIEDAMTKLRKRGGVMVAGIQSTAQLIAKYGEVGAQILLSCFNNVLMLKVADDQTAGKLSAMIGDIEIPEKSTSTSVTETSEGTSTTKGTSTQLVRKPSYMPGEFMQLEDLYGVARISGMKAARRTMVQFSKLPKIAKAEETRSDVYLDLD